MKHNAGEIGAFHGHGTARSVGWTAKPVDLCRHACGNDMTCVMRGGNRRAGSAIGLVLAFSYIAARHAVGVGHQRSWQWKLS